MSAGVAINTSDNNLLAYSGGYWRQYSATFNLVLKKLSGYYSADTAIADYAVGRANNGLFYDNFEGGNNNWYDARDYCINKGMRLPTIPETTNSDSANGVPNDTGNWAWTNTVVSGSYFIWQGTSQTSGSGDYPVTGSNRVRCVK